MSCTYPLSGSYSIPYRTLIHFICEDNFQRSFLGTADFQTTRSARSGKNIDFNGPVQSVAEVDRAEPLSKADIHAKRATLLFDAPAAIEISKQETGRDRGGSAC